MYKMAKKGGGRLHGLPKTSKQLKKRAEPVPEFSFTPDTRNDPHYAAVELAETKRDDIQSWSLYSTPTPEDPPVDVVASVIFRFSKPNEYVLVGPAAPLVTPLVCLMMGRFPMVLSIVKDHYDNCVRCCTRILQDALLRKGRALNDTITDADIDAVAAEWAPPGNPIAFRWISSSSCCYNYCSTSCSKCTFPPASFHVSVFCAMPVGCCAVWKKIPSARPVIFVLPVSPTHRPACFRCCNISVCLKESDQLLGNRPPVTVPLSVPVTSRPRGTSLRVRPS